MSINGTDSEKKRLTSGVPQGSLLGPRLFSIFTNDFPLSLDSKIEMFADDSTAYIIGNSIDSISIEIQNLLHQLLTWSKFNSMFIHPTKSEVMFISKIPFIGPIRPMTIDNKTISCVHFGIYLLQRYLAKCDLLYIFVEIFQIVGRP